MVYILILSTGIICGICLQVNGQCTTPEFKSSSEAIDDVFVATGVVWSNIEGDGQYSTSVCEDSSAGADETVCPSGFDYLPGADACYRVIFQLLDWNRSRQECKSVMSGVHLAAITSAEKQQAIKNYLEEQFNKTESSVCRIPIWPNIGKSVWINGQTKDPQRCTPFVWKTLNAEEIPFIYNNWATGQPDCANSDENCAHIVEGWKYEWNDARCTIMSCALCEF